MASDSVMTETTTTTTTNNDDDGDKILKHNIRAIIHPINQIMINSDCMLHTTINNNHNDVEDRSDDNDIIDRSDDNDINDRSYNDSPMVITPRIDAGKIRQQLAGLIYQTQHDQLYRQYKLTTAKGHPLPMIRHITMCDQIRRMINMNYNSLNFIRYDVYHDYRDGWIYITIFLAILSTKLDYVDLSWSQDDLLDENYNRYISYYRCIIPHCQCPIVKDYRCLLHSCVKSTANSMEYYKKQFYMYKIQQLIEIRNQLIEFIENPIPKLSSNNYDLVLPDYSVVRNFKVVFQPIKKI